MTKKLITLTLEPNEKSQLVGVIGAHSSDLSKIVADFLRVFEIPQISYGSTASVLSDKTIYSYFFRTVPPDKMQARAIADICVELGWTYVSIVNSYGLYGEKGAENFRQAAKSTESSTICIAQQLKLKAFPSEQEYDDLVQSLKDKDPMAHAVVMFTEIRDTRKILEALKRNNITKQFYWIGSDGWGNNLNAVENFESYGEGAITLTQLDTPVKGFSEYFESLNVSESKNENNTWLREYWESHFHCNLPGSNHYFLNCSGKERLSTSKLPTVPVQTVVNAVYAMAHALHNYVKNRCDSNDCEITRSILLDYLKNVSFNDAATGELLKFDKNQEISRNYSIHSLQKFNGSYVYKPVGIWSETNQLQLYSSKLSWPKHKGNNPPVSICSETCSNGYYRQGKGSHNISCCWECAACKSREIVKDAENICFECPYGEVPDTNQSYCMALPTIDVMSRGSSKALLVISMFGLTFVIIAAVIFFKHGNVPLIKASSRELSGIIFFGLALLFIFPWLLISTPTTSLCIAEPIILGVALASCYAPLFMKILRIYRIFKTARKSAGKPILISPTSQVLIAVGLITIQLLFSLISFFPTPPEPVTREIDDEQSLFIECSMGRGVFATLLSYNMFLMILCTIMAFKTRKFPRNFNEAKYIGFTMYFTCFVWIIFFPSYLSRGNGLGRIIWECSAVILVGWITLIGLFGPKICHLVLGDHLSSNTDQLAVTNNTVSQAAVVSTRSYNTESSVDMQVKQGEVNEHTKKEEKRDKEAETTSC